MNKKENRLDVITWNKLKETILNKEYSDLFENPLGWSCFSMEYKKYLSNKMIEFLVDNKGAIHINTYRDDDEYGLLDEIIIHNVDKRNKYNYVSDLIFLIVGGHYTCVNMERLYD